MKTSEQKGAFGMKGCLRKILTVSLLALVLSAVHTAMALGYGPVEVTGNRAHLSFESAVREERTLTFYENVGGRDSITERTVSVIVVEPGSHVTAENFSENSGEENAFVYATVYTKTEKGYDCNVYDGSVRSPRTGYRLPAGNVDAWFDGTAGLPDSLYQVTTTLIDSRITQSESVYILYGMADSEKETSSNSPNPVSVENAGRKTPFDDVPAGVYYEDAVAWAAAQGITLGTTETTFSPNNTTTRGNVMTFLWRWAGQAKPNNEGSPFSDVAETSYCYSAVQWAVGREVSNGTTQSTFSPNSLCSYAHVLTLLWRFMGNPVPAGTGTLAGKYPGRYYQNAVVWAEEHGLLESCLTGFSPVNPCPRSDVVQFLYLMNRKSVKECVEGLSSLGMTNPNGGEAKITMDMVTNTELWSYAAWPEHTLTLTDRYKDTIIWIIGAKTPFTYGGLPRGGPMRNVGVRIVMNAQTGAVMESGFGGERDESPERFMEQTASHS